MDIVERLRESDNETEFVSPIGDEKRLTLAWEAAEEIVVLRNLLADSRTFGQAKTFVGGAKWWHERQSGATAFASEVDEMEREAIRIFGLPTHNV